MADALTENNVRRETATKPIRTAGPDRTNFVVYSDSRTKEQLDRGTICVTNEGLLGVQLDADYFSGLLRQAGLTREQINETNIKFRRGRYADRNLYGELIGGYQFGNNIEVYTSLPTGGDWVHSTQIPIRPEALNESVLHEVGHRIQEAQGRGNAGTMGKGGQDVEQHPLEIEADEFARAHLEEAKSHIGLEEIPGLEFKDNTGPKRVVGDLAGAGKYYDLDRALQITDTDHPAVFYIDQVQRLVNKGELAQKADVVVAKGKELVEKGFLGYAEYNGLVGDLAEAMSKDGKEETAKALLSSQYKGN